MRIVQRYIREDAPEQVNISEECRETILATDAAYDIFDEARAEVLAVLEVRSSRRTSKKRAVLRFGSCLLKVLSSGLFFLVGDGFFHPRHPQPGPIPPFFHINIDVPTTNDRSVCRPTSKETS